MTLTGADLVEMSARHLLQSMHDPKLGQEEWLRRFTFRTWREVPLQALPERGAVWSEAYGRSEFGLSALAPADLIRLVLYPFEYLRSDGLPALVFDSYAFPSDSLAIFQRHPPLRWDDDALPLSVYDSSVHGYARSLAVDFFTWHRASRTPTRLAALEIGEPREPNPPECAYAQPIESRPRRCMVCLSDLPLACPNMELPESISVADQAGRNLWAQIDLNPMPGVCLAQHYAPPRPDWPYPVDEIALELYATPTHEPYLVIAHQQFAFEAIAMPYWRGDCLNLAYRRYPLPRHDVEGGHGSSDMHAVSRRLGAALATEFWSALAQQAQSPTRRRLGALEVR